MLDLNLDQFADARAGGSQISHDEIPFHVAILFQLTLQKLVVGVADNVLQKVLLLHLDCFQLHLTFVQKRQILVHPLNAQVDGLGLEMLHQIALIGHQTFMRHTIIPRMIVLHRPEIRRDRIGGQVGFP